MPSPAVTVITPSLNQGRFIGATIESVRQQSYRPIVHRVYDGGSTDETPAVLARYRDGVDVISEPDGGQAAAINRGLREATTDIVAWINSDDVYLPGAIATAVAYLESHPSCAMVYGNALYIDADGRVIGRYPTAPVSSLRDGCYICQPATFMRREAVAAVGFLDPRLRFCMDYDLWLRLAERYEIGRVDAELAASRLHAAAKTVSQRLAFHREVVEMTERRLGAAPLTWLYGYAECLARARLRIEAETGVGYVVVRLAAVTLSLALAARYHRRLGRADIAAIIGRFRARVPPATPGDVGHERTPSGAPLPKGTRWHK